MIRPAVSADVERIAEMGERFHAEAGWGDVAGYNRADTARTLAFMVGSPDCVLLVCDKGGGLIGMAGGMAAPLYFNHAERLAQELFFWIEPGHRGDGIRLIRAYEQAMRGIGATVNGMIELASLGRAGNLYAREGYRASETSWIKRL